MNSFNMQRTLFLVHCFLGPLDVIKLLNEYAKIWIVLRYFVYRKCKITFRRLRIKNTPPNQDPCFDYCLFGNKSKAIFFRQYSKKH